MAILGHGLLIMLDENTPTMVWAPILVVLGIGYGALVMPLICCVQATIPAEDVAHATVSYSFLRTLGLSIGIAIAGTVFQNAMHRHLGNLGLPTEVAGNAETFLEVIKSLPVGSAQRHQFVLAYSRSFRTVFEVLVCFMGAKLLASLLIQNRTMNQRLGSEYFIATGRRGRMRL